MTMIKKPALMIAFALVSVSLLAGCSPKVTYGEAGAVEQVTSEFGSTDLQMIAEKMVQSLLEDTVVNSKPVVYVTGVRNNTDEHIDTKSITDKIRTALIKSKKVRFPAREEAMDTRLKEKALADQGWTEKDTAIKMGKMLNANYILEGELSSIKKKTSSYKDVYFKFTLNLVNLESDEIVWAEEKEIRKGEEKPTFGW